MGVLLNQEPNCHSGGPLEPKMMGSPGWASRQPSGHFCVCQQLSRAGASWGEVGELGSVPKEGVLLRGTQGHFSAGVGEGQRLWGAAKLC